MRPLLLLALAACTGNGDIVGPFKGPVTRFAVDHFTLPASHADIDALGDDLTGDGIVDNGLGIECRTLADYQDLNTHGDDMIAAGALASFVELQAPDLQTAAKAGATYYGADGEAAVVAGGGIADGIFISNRTRTTHVPGKAVLYLPVFGSADPSIVELVGMELDLRPDGSGGYDALVRGGVTVDSLGPAMCAGLQQMILNDPDHHYGVATLVDPEHTGQLTCDLVLGSEFIAPYLLPDVTLAGAKAVSFGFGAHLVPCDSGSCVTAPPADHCDDRVRDGDETDVDCGGSCMPCPVANPSCTDGVRDGLETDVDCGWNCKPCSRGQHCYGPTGCVAGTVCSAPDVTQPGECVASP